MESATRSNWVRHLTTKSKLIFLITTFIAKPRPLIVTELYPRYLIAHTIDKTLNERAKNKGERNQIFKSIDFNFLFWAILTVLIYLSICTMFVYLLGARKNLRRTFRSLIDQNNRKPIDRSLAFGLTVFLFIASLLTTSTIKTTTGGL